MENKIAKIEIIYKGETFILTEENPIKYILPNYSSSFGDIFVLRKNRLITNINKRNYTCSIEYLRDKYIEKDLILEDKEVKLEFSKISTKNRKKVSDFKTLEMSIFYDEKNKDKLLYIGYRKSRKKHVFVSCVSHYSSFLQNRSIVEKALGRSLSFFYKDEINDFFNLRVHLYGNSFVKKLKIMSTLDLKIEEEIVSNIISEQIKNYSFL